MGNLRFTDGSTKDAVVAIFIGSRGEIAAVSGISQLTLSELNNQLGTTARDATDEDYEYIECSLSVWLANEQQEGKVYGQPVTQLKVCYDQLGNPIRWR